MKFGNNMVDLRPDSGMQPFWVLWVEGSNGGYGYQHSTVDSAAREAARLAEQSGRKVFVLQLVGACKIDVIKNSYWTQPAESPVSPTEVPF